MLSRSAPEMPAAPPPDATESARRASDGAHARQMARSALILSVGTLVSRLLGMARETLIAATFDVASTDAFFTAWRVPNALREALADGAARYVFQPVMGEALHKHDGGDAQGVARLRTAVAEIRGAALLVLTLVTVIGVVFARPIFRVVSGGFGGDVARFELGVTLLRILFPFIFFMGWFAIGNTALQLRRRFVPGTFGPILQNVAFLVAPFALVPLLAPYGVAPIYSMALGALLGGVLQVAALVPALRREGLSGAPIFAWNDRVRAVAKAFGPQLYGQSVYQINSVVAGVLLAELPRGAASFYSYGQRLAQIPQGLFAVAFSTAAGAAYQQFASRGDYAGVARRYEEALRMTLFFALPASVLMAVYAEAVVPLVFGYGRFRALGDHGVLQVVASLRWQCIAIAFLAMVNQTTAVFGALAKRKEIVKIATIDMLIFVVVGVVASRRVGHVGVAFAVACAAAVQLVLLLARVRHIDASTHIPVDFRSIGPALARVLFATGITALVARAVVLFLPVTGFAFGNKVLAVACGIGLIALYLCIAWLLGSPEMSSVTRRLRRR